MPLSATEAVRPAFACTWRRLAERFRLGFWLRVSVIVMTTGNFFGSCSLDNFNNYVPSSHDPAFEELRPFLPPGLKLGPLMPYLVIIAVVFIVVAIHWTYAASVSHFILFETVLDGQCELKQAWERWKRQGFRFFLWSLAFFLATLLAFAVAPGAWLAIGLAGFFIGAVARDFLVPVMALENRNVLDGWRQLLAMMREEKMTYTRYLLMKLLLALVSTLVFGVLTFFVCLIAAIPLAGLGAGIVAIWKAAALTWTRVTVSSVEILGMGALAYLLFIASLVSAPAAYFFQAYAIYFMAGRYPLLAGRMESSRSQQSRRRQSAPGAA